MSKSKKAVKVFIPRSTSASGTAAHYVVSTSTTSEAAVPSFVTLPHGRASIASGHDSVDAAVFAHIQAVRALGHETVSTGEIARALGLTHAQVLLAATRLRNKGVKALAR